MTRDEEKTKEKFVEMKILEEQIGNLQQQVQVVEHQLEELMGAVSTLEEFEGLKGGEDVLFPISNGIFAKARLKDPGELLVNVGEGTVVLKDIKSAKSILNEQLGEMSEMQQKIIFQMQRFAEHAKKVEAELKKLASEE